MASDDFWQRFNSGWTTEVLQKIEPHAPYLHMKELRSRNGAYADFTEERRNRLVWDAVDYLQSQPKKAFCATVCCINETALHDLVAQGCTIREPPRISTDWSVDRSFAWYYDTLPDALEPAYVNFDKGEKFMHDFRQRWLKDRKPRRGVFTNTFWGLIVDVTAKDMRITPALQAADLLAWSESRRRASTEDRRFRHLAKIIEGVIPSWRAVLDREALERLFAPDLSISDNASTRKFRQSGEP